MRQPLLIAAFCRALNDHFVGPYAGRPFVSDFWHCKCVCGLTKKAFTAKCQKWCKKYGCNFTPDKALDIYSYVCGYFSVMHKTAAAKLLIEQAVSQRRAASAALTALRNEMQSLATSLPEYPVVMECLMLVLPLVSNSWRRYAMYANSIRRKH